MLTRGCVEKADWGLTAGGNWGGLFIEWCILLIRGCIEEAVRRERVSSCDFGLSGDGLFKLFFEALRRYR
jgi:hypothetical protein